MMMIPGERQYSGERTELEEISTFLELDVLIMKA
jgi:hypothetical protein